MKKYIYASFFAILIAFIFVAGDRSEELAAATLGNKALSAKINSLEGELKAQEKISKLAMEALRLKEKEFHYTKVAYDAQQALALVRVQEAVKLSEQSCMSKFSDAAIGFKDASFKSAKRLFE